MGPEVGLRLVMAGVTAKFHYIAGEAPHSHSTPKVLIVKLLGTGTVMLVELQLVGVAVVPLNCDRAGSLRRPEIRALIVTVVPICLTSDSDS